MAKDILPQSQPQVAAAQHSTPTAREIRAHALHRLQIGLFGLATMLLIVGLANIIMDRARLVEPDGRPAVVNDGGSARSDPLADIGVVPAADPSAAPQPVDTGN